MRGDPDTWKHGVIIVRPDERRFGLLHLAMPVTATR